MKLRTIGILVLLLFPFVCPSQVRPRPPVQRPAPATPPAFMQQLKAFDQDSSVTKVILKNDVTILVAEAHANSLVEVMTWIRTGYRDDPADLPGISHLLENMLLRGTATRSAAVLAADLKALGGTFGSTTAYDHTSFRSVAPAAQWKRALEIQADFLLNPLLDAQELKRQIAVVSDEMAFETADPQALARWRLMETGFAGERLGRGRGLRSEASSRITRERLLGFYQTACSPSRILMVICGDVPTLEVLNAAAGLYGKAKGAASTENRVPAKDLMPGFRYAQVRGSGKLAQVHIGFPASAASSSDYSALEVLRAILGTGEGAVLNRRLKHQKRIVSSATVEGTAFADTGYLEMRLEMDPNELDRCELAAFAEFEILKEQEPDEAELERARAQLARAHWEVLQTVSGRAERLARFEALGSWKNMNGYLNRLGQVKWSDVARVAAKYLRLDACALIEFLPAQAEARMLSAETIQGTIKDLLAPAVAQELAEREKATVPAIDVPPDAGAFKPAELRYSFQMASILRGPDLFIKEDHTLPLIHMGLFFAGGKLRETRANAGITSLMLRTMLRSSKTRSCDQLDRQLELYGAALTPVVEDDYFGINFSIPSTNIERGLDLLSEMIKSPKLDPEELVFQKQLQTAALRRRTDNELARLRLRQMLFNDHPYALDANGSEESVATITPEAIQEWYRTNVADKRPMVVIIGDTQGSSLAGFFVRNFSGSRYQEVTPPEVSPKPLESKVSAEQSWSGSTSSIFMAFQAPPEGDEDSFPLMALRSYAADLSGRLVNRVQEEVRSAYRVSLQYEPELRGGSITACLTAAPADEEKALKVLAEELQRLATNPVTYRDYRTAVNAAIGEILIRQQDRFRLIADLIKSILQRKGIEAYQECTIRLQEVKQTDLQDMAQRFFKVDKSVTLRLHGKAER